MLKRSLVAKVLPGLAVSGVLIASIVASPAALFGSLSGYGYGVCGYGYNAFSGTATVTGLSPTSGTTAGGTSVFITGSGYCNTVSAVHFGASPAQSINVLADTLIQAITPAHSRHQDEQWNAWPRGKRELVHWRHLRAGERDLSSAQRHFSGRVDGRLLHDLPDGRHHSYRIQPQLDSWRDCA